MGRGENTRDDESGGCGVEIKSTERGAWTDRIYSTWITENCLTCLASVSELLLAEGEEGGRLWDCRKDKTVTALEMKGPCPLWSPSLQVRLQFFING